MWNLLKVNNKDISGVALVSDISHLFLVLDFEKVMFASFILPKVKTELENIIIEQPFTIVLKLVIILWKKYSF